MPAGNTTPAIKSVTVKNFRPHSGLSEETLAFTASIYVNGRRAGQVRNDGTGGCNLYSFDDPVIRDAFRQYAREWGEENDELIEPEDGLIGQLCEDYDARKLMRRELAAGAAGLIVIYKKPGWFAGPAAPRGSKPHYYDEAQVVVVHEGTDPAEVAARHNAHAWRVVPIEGV